MKKFRELLFNHQTVSYILIIGFWSRILFSIIANSVDEGANYQAAEAFEPLTTEQELLMDGAGTGEENETSLLGN
jgi:hypothetical protein